MSLNAISAVIIAHNSEATLSACLRSLERLPEVVIYENGSNDRTVEIARKFSNVRLEQGEFIGFGPTKNLAAKFSCNDWVLSLDSDEEVSSELIDELAALDLGDPKNLYKILRQNFFMGEHVKHSGWGNDWLPRLYNRKSHSYNEALVHENIIPLHDANIQKLRGPLRHRAVSEISQFLVKIDRYTELRMQEGSKGYGPLVSLLKANWAFFRSFILQLGILDGWRGVVIAWGDACGVFYRCMKCYARDQQKKATKQDSAS
ncbi:MAG: glycosyltransferase family 2 protein [Gammaproteobacteria bacterium]|nr:glycosyltransferase family 2 protein [Gammaproteobacteria bacterium]